MKGLLLRFSGFVAACVLGLLVFLFAMELLVFRSSSYGDLLSSRPFLEEDAFSVCLRSDAPLALFKGFRYQVEEDALYITVYSGDFYTSSRCREWPITLRIQDAALEGVERVYLKDGNSVKRIYPA